MQDNDNPYQSPQSNDKLAPSDDGDTFIRITRTTSFADYFRAYQIFVDGEKRGRLEAGASINISVAPGQHIVVAKLDWCGSPEVMLDVESNSSISLECGSNLRGFRIFLALIYITILPSQYLALTRID